MTTVFDATDPRNVVVVCTDERWAHVLLRHPRMKDKMDVVKRAIERPTFITRDPLDPTCQIYYVYPSEGRVPFRMAVAVRMTAEKSGFMLSAYPSSAPKRGEEIIWPVLGH